MITAAVGIAVAWIAVGSVPALADQVRSQEWWLAKLHVTQAWQTTKGSGATVALLDTGVDSAQPDLSGSVITGPDLTNSSEKPGSEFFGIHGTAMASLIVGHGHGPGDSAGIMGVAPQARLLSVRVNLDGTDPLASESAITSALPNAIAAGIRYAVSNGAQVIDLPLDPGQTPSDLVAPTPTPTPTPSASPAPSPTATPTPDGTTAEQQAVAYALSQGVVLVAPGGDNGNGTDAPNFPAGYPGVISVGAFDSGFIKAPFSSHQAYVTLTAAGEGMIAAVPPNGYATVSSTSAASAVVTGIAALIKSEFPELTPAQVTQALTRGTVIRPPGGMADGSGHGTVDAARALAQAAAIASPGLHRAGAGAVSRQLPAAPAASPLAGESLRPKLVRDALISLALLAVLLVPVTIFGLLQGRRRRARAQARAEHEQAARAPYAHNGDATADMMGQYFATLPGQAGGYTGAQAAAEPAGGRPGDPRPGQAGARPTRRGAAPPAADPVAHAEGGLAGPGFAHTEGGPAGPGFAHTEGGPAGPGFAPAEETGRHAGGQAPRSPLTPITRASTPRPPKVSGAPPWEPAPQPEGEVPWASSPAPPALGRRAAAQPRPATSSIWAAATPNAPVREANGGQPDDGAESGGRPIYVWNPSATTETFPQVPRDGGS
jgi:hypothetical protein